MVATYNFGSVYVAGIKSQATFSRQKKWRNKRCNSFAMGCLPVRGDNPRALASGLSYVQVDKHGITILFHLHLCRHCS